jgi:hypothetical protein
MRMKTMLFLLVTIMLCDAVARAESLADQFKSQRDEKFKNYDRDMAVIDEASKLYRNIEAHGQRLALDPAFEGRGTMILVRNAIIRIDNSGYSSPRIERICDSERNRNRYSDVWLELTPEVVSIAKDDVFEIVGHNTYEINLKAGTCFYKPSSKSEIKKCKATLEPISQEYSYLQYRLKNAREHCAIFYEDMR